MANAPMHHKQPIQCTPCKTFNKIIIGECSSSFILHILSHQLQCIRCMFPIDKTTTKHTYIFDWWFKHAQFVRLRLRQWSNESGIFRFTHTQNKKIITIKCVNRRLFQSIFHHPVLLDDWLFPLFSLAYRHVI